MRPIVGSTVTEDEDGMQTAPEGGLPVWVAFVIVGVILLAFVVAILTS